MEYLKAAVELKRFIQKTNNNIPPVLASEETNPQRMILRDKDKRECILDMQEFTNEFVKETLNKEKNTEFLIICDRAHLVEDGKRMNYYLYKGYHKLIEKGLVYFQPITEKEYDPIGKLGFSTMEENIFFEQAEPQFEESTCNAMETDESQAKEKKIVLFIGNLNEERLTYDIQRLVFDTVNNIHRHQSVTFDFIIEISKYGSEPTEQIMENVKKIAAYTQTEVAKEYTNATFEFKWAK